MTPTATDTATTLEPDLRVRIGNLVLPNPVGLASGTFGYGLEYEELVNVDSLGALYTKAVTPEPRAGNPPPRLVETPAGMINSIGLANPGIDAFVRDKLPALRARRCPVIVNVAGSTEDDYLRVVSEIEAAAGPAIARNRPCAVPTSNGSIRRVPSGRAWLREVSITRRARFSIDSAGASIPYIHA